MKTYTCKICGSSFVLSKHNSKFTAIQKSTSTCLECLKKFCFDDNKKLKGGQK